MPIRAPLASTRPDRIIQQLQPFEDKIQYLRATLAGYTDGAGTQPHFNYIEAETGEFVVPPFRSAMFRRTTTQGIGQWTAVALNEEVWNNGWWELSTSDGKITFPRPPLLEGFWMFGWARFADNSSGQRGIRLVWNGTVNGVATTQYDTITYATAAGTTRSVLTIEYPFRYHSSATGFYLEAFQNGKASDELAEVQLGIIDIKRLT